MSALAAMGYSPQSRRMIAKARGLVILNRTVSSFGWKKWLDQYEAIARKHNVWDLVDPNLSVSPKLVEPTLDLPRIWSFESKDKLDWEYRKYQMIHKEWEVKQAHLLDFLMEVHDTLDAGWEIYLTDPKLIMDDMRAIEKGVRNRTSPPEEAFYVHG
jgi:hypothetical protein